MEVAIFVSVGLGILTVIALIFFLVSKRSWDSNREDNSARIKSSTGSAKDDESHPQATHTKGSRSRGKYQPQKKSSLGPHPYLAANFKGHTDDVVSLSFEPGGKYLASSSKDRTIRVWIMKTIDHKEKKFGSVSVNYDYASNVAFSPDGTAVLAVIKDEDEVSVYKISKQGSGVSLLKTLQFPLCSNRSLNVSLGIAPNGSFIMACNEKCFSLWKTKDRELLATVQTNLSPNTCAVVSPCSKFVACAGFTTSVKIWEVEHSKSGEFEKLVCPLNSMEIRGTIISRGDRKLLEVSSAMTLNGHSASVVSVHFSIDSKRVVTVSNDKTCRIWDIDVRYRMQENTRCLQVMSLDPAQAPNHVALSPDGLVIAVAINTSVSLYSCNTGELIERLINIHNDTISQLLWEPHSHYLVTAGGGDRYIRLWHNVPGMREQLIVNKEKLRMATSEPLKVRLKEDISKLEERLKEIEDKTA